MVKKALFSWLLLSKPKKCLTIGMNRCIPCSLTNLAMMFTGIGQSAANGIIKKIKDNVDEEFNDYLLFYQGSFKDQMKALDLDKKTMLMYLCSMKRVRLFSKIPVGTPTQNWKKLLI